MGYDLGSRCYDLKRVTDKEFIAEVGPWGFAVMVAAMLGIAFSRYTTGLTITQSVGYSLSALLLVPMVWVFAGRYASFWLAKLPSARVQVFFVGFWTLLIAKLFFLPWPESVSAAHGATAAVCAGFAGFAAWRAFRRIAAGLVEPLHDRTFTPSLLLPILVAVFATLFVV
jgi:hypothetical protein